MRPAPVAPATPAAAPVAPAPLAAAPASEPADPRDVADEGIVHRRLIRATLPKVEGAEREPRPIPTFTVHEAANARNKFRRFPRPAGQGFGQGGGNGNPNGNGNAMPQRSDMATAGSRRRSAAVVTARAGRKPTGPAASRATAPTSSSVAAPRAAERGASPAPCSNNPVSILLSDRHDP